MVPTLGGGTLDRPARLLQKLWQDEKLVTVPVVIVNRGGEGQSAGYTYVHQATGDPHRLLMVSQPLASNHITERSKLNHTDFSLMALLYNEYNVLSVRADAP